MFYNEDLLFQNVNLHIFSQLKKYFSTKKIYIASDILKKKIQYTRLCNPVSTNYVLV